jgi:hypothetical protein
MSRYTLNIGLANPFTGQENSIERTLYEATKHIATIQNLAIKQSATERTVVIDFDTIVGTPNVLACALDQDCIALLDNVTGEGFLYGDKAEAWAPFNPEFFLTIS